MVFLEKKEKSYSSYSFATLHKQKHNFKKDLKAHILNSIIKMFDSYILNLMSAMH